MPKRRKESWKRRDLSPRQRTAIKVIGGATVGYAGYHTARTGIASYRNRKLITSMTKQLGGGVGDARKVMIGAPLLTAGVALGMGYGVARITAAASRHHNYKQNYRLAHSNKVGYTSGRGRQAPHVSAAMRRQAATKRRRVQGRFA